MSIRNPSSFAAVWLMALSLFSGMAAAQEANDGDQQAQLEEIVVVGRYQGSLRRSLEQKRSSEQIVEAISAEDIGLLPDTTIAESLSRLPGLYAIKDRGNDSLIVARGFAPGLSIGTMNGRELATAETERTVRYEQFPSELISRAQVYKTQNAAILEGGIGATINLETLNPLDFQERGGTLKLAGLQHARAGERPRSDENGLRASGSYYDQFAENTVGLALGFSRNDQPSVLSHYDNWGWNTFSNADVDDDGTPDYAPWGSGPVFLTGSEVRTSTMAKLQFEPDERLSVTLDAYHTDWKIREDEDNVWNCCWDNWDDWQDQAGGFTNEVVIDNYVVAGTISKGAEYFTSVASRWVQDNSTAAGGINIQYDTNLWMIEADLSTSAGRRENIWRGINFNYAGPPVTVRYDFRPTRPITSYIDGTGAAVLDLSNYTPGSMSVSSDAELDDGIDTVELSLGRAMDAGFLSRVDFGVRIREREKTHRSRGWSQSPNIATIPREVLDSAVGYVLDGQLQLIQVDFDLAQGVLYGGLDSANRPYDDARGWEVSEDVVSAWISFAIEGLVGNVPVAGNIGIRHVSTDQTGRGTEFVNDVARSINEGMKYENTLPSLNLNFQLSDGQVLRFGLGRSIARAPVDELRPNRSINLDVSGSPVFTGSGGNPTLEPFEANYADLSYEYYFGDDALAAVAWFYKDVTTYIGVAIDEFVIDGAPARISRPVNGNGGKVSGFELTLQTPFSALPGFLRDFGVNLNYAYLDSNIIEDQPADNPLPLSGLAEDNLSLILWYFKENFELRASYSYRSDSTALFRGSLQTLEAAEYLDASVSYDVSPRLRLKLELGNITNEGVRTHFDRNSSSVGRYRQHGRRASIGVDMTF